MNYKFISFLLLRVAICKEKQQPRWIYFQIATLKKSKQIYWLFTFGTWSTAKWIWDCSKDSKEIEQGIMEVILLWKKT